MKSLADIWKDGKDIEKAEIARLRAVGQARSQRQARVFPTASPVKKTAPPEAANDNTPGDSEPLPVVRPSSWEGAPVPERRWFVPGLIPDRTVTMLSGDGGLGKSLASLQIAAASALGGLSTMGVTPVAGRVLYVGAEDEPDEFHRRLAAILRHFNRSFEDLGDRLELVALSDRDATLMRPAAAQVMAPTQLMADLIERICAFKPNLIVLDTNADLFGGVVAPKSPDISHGVAWAAMNSRGERYLSARWG